MNNGVIFFDPQDAATVDDCKLHGEYEGGYCPDCYLDERRREQVQEVAEAIKENE